MVLIVPLKIIVAHFCSAFNHEDEKGGKYRIWQHDQDVFLLPFQILYSWSFLIWKSVAAALSYKSPWSPPGPLPLYSQTIPNPEKIPYRPNYITPSHPIPSWYYTQSCPHLRRSERSKWPNHHLGLSCPPSNVGGDGAKNNTCPRSNVGPESTKSWGWVLLLLLLLL